MNKDQLQFTITAVSNAQATTLQEAELKGECLLELTKQIKKMFDEGEIPNAED